MPRPLVVFGVLVVAAAAVFSFELYTDEDFQDTLAQKISQWSDGRIPLRQHVRAQAIQNLSEAAVYVRASNLVGPLQLSGCEGTGVFIDDSGYLVGAAWTVVGKQPGSLYVLTAAHVVCGEAITVQRPGKALGNARVLSKDSVADVALLEVTYPPNVNNVGITMPPIAGAAPSKGDTVVVRCHLDEKLRDGIVVDFVTRAGDVPNFVTSIAAEEGCSGAPVLNVKGELVGIVIQGSSQDSTAAVITSAGGQSPRSPRNGG